MVAMKTASVMLLILGIAACGGDDESTAPLPGTDVQAFMTRYFQVFDQRVQADIVALFAADVQADISGLGALDGLVAVRDEWLLPFTNAFPDYTHTVDQMNVSGQRAVADFVFHGTHQGELLGYAPTGNELTLPICGTYDVANDLVTSFTLEYDVNIVLTTISQ
jgi:predicted ester cyclase